MTQERRRAAPSEKDHGVEPVGAGSCRPDTSAITADPDHLEPAPTGTVGETEIWPNRPGAPPGHWKREGTIEEPSARARRHAGTCRAAAGRSRTHPRARRHGVDYSRTGDAGLSRKGASVHHRPPEESHYFLLCPGANIHLIDFLKQHPFESAKREEYAHRHRLGE